MSIFLQQIINGISIGSIYALIALGYTMVYGIIKLINFAHGDILMIGAYIGFFLTAKASIPFIEALLIAMALCGFVGIAIERVAYKPLRKSSRITALITAIGVSLLLEYTMMYFVGAEVKTYKPLLPSISYNIGGAVFTFQQIVIIITTFILMVILQFVLKHTKPGKAMRAVSIDSDAAQLMGINVDATISFTFFLGSSLAGVAGVLVGVYYSSINPLMGVTPGLKAFIAAVFGGIGSIPGAVLGGFAIGIIETFVSGYINSMYRDSAVFGFLILVLIVMPSGLIGQKIVDKV